MALSGFDAQMVHSVTIKRPGHTIAGQAKVLSEPTTYTGVRCRIEGAGDTPMATLMGIGASEAWRGFFPSGTDLKVGDVVIADGEPGVTMVVMGSEPRYAGTSAVHHFEVTLKTRQV